MSIWLFRAGKNGEYEEKFLTDNKELFDNYEKLSPAIKIEIPLKQIWILSEEE